MQSFNLQSLNWTPMVCQDQGQEYFRTKPQMVPFLLATHYLINKSWSDQTKKSYFSCGSDASMHQRHQRKVMTWFSGTSRGCCSCIPLVLFPSPPLLRAWAVLEIMLIVSANFWKGRRWQNMSQSRAGGASNGVYINFRLWEIASPCLFNKNAKQTFKEGWRCQRRGGGMGSCY